MKKYLALVLALVLVFALVGCGPKTPELLGTYTTEIDLTDMVVENYDSGTGFGGTDLSLENYLDSFTLVMVSQFNEDGTYAQYLDQESLDTAMENMAAACVPMMDDLLLATFVEQFAVYNYTVETKEDVEAIVNMSWDEIISSSLGMSLEEFIDQIIDELDDEFQTDEPLAEGQYKAEGGKLYLSEGLDTEVSEGAYETYEINGNVVTITGGVNIEENEYLSYPFDLVKSAE